MEKKKKIALAAGCSGGHITPALTIANQYPDCDALFFAKNNRLDKDILQASTVHTSIFLSLINVPRNNLVQFPKFFFQFGIAFITSLNTLYRHKPIKIISTGSYIALPVCMAGWLLRIPIELYELNVEPGQAIRWLSKIATTIYVCFAATQKILPNAIVTPYPVRFKPQDRDMRPNLHGSYNIAPTSKTLLVLGGSQGSEQLNRMIQEVLDDSTLETHWHIIHQTGNDRSVDWTQWYRKRNIQAITFSYTPNIADYYVLADLIISRAGAGTLAEIAFFGKKCIIIPLNANTTQHQIRNALAHQADKPEQFTVLEQQTAASAIKGELKSISK